MHSSHRFRIKSTVALPAGGGDPDEAGDAVAAVEGGAPAVPAGPGDPGDPDEPADPAARRGADEDVAALPAGSLAGAAVIVVPVVVVTGLGSTPSLDVLDARSLVAGGGGGMSRAGPVVGSKLGVPDASVVAALASDPDVGSDVPLAGPETAAATSTPASDMTSSNAPHGSHGGSARL